MVVVVLLSVDLVESVDLVSVYLVVNCTMYLGLCSMHSRRHLPICWLWWNVTALQKKFDALVVSLGGRQMERGSSIKVADTHVMPHEHVPAI